ncbi:efflux RND transporter periplasmic adaptor subunit [Ramlibacter sp. AN1133]|uniref:efflux RND transporter periplasmic adaptor subunit n=1 Tax=Ramlibacter sp. AN1133 TaxID=3133429 RepID=UPI0030C34332
MRRTTLAIVAAAGVLLVAAAGLASWRLLRPLPVAATAITQGSVEASVSGPGTVQARVPVTLSARLTSTVVRVDADVGDAVHRGQRLVVLDARDLSARRSAVLSQQESVARQVEAADAAVAKADADLEGAVARQRRDADLHATGFVSVASLDASTATARAAQAALLGARATAAARRADQLALRQEGVVADTLLGHAQLTAPMAGVVIQRLVEPGTTVAPGTPILRIVDPASLWVTTRVDEAVVEQVRAGQAATIRLRSGTVVRGQVTRVALQSDAATRELDVQVSFAGTPPRVAIDQEAQVRIATGRVAGLVAPVSALAQDASGRRGVLRVVAGRTHFVAVETGPSADGQVLVRAGLSAGDVVVSDASRARPGMRVQPVVAATAQGQPWNSR